MKTLKLKDIVKGSDFQDNVEGLFWEHGIYFLMYKKKIVYIGKAESFFGINIFNHLKQDKIDFDYFYIHKLQEDDSLEDIQAQYIVKFQPKYNYTLPKNSIYMSKYKIKHFFKGVDWRIIKRGVREGFITSYFNDTAFKEEQIGRYLNTLKGG